VGNSNIIVDEVLVKTTFVVSDTEIGVIGNNNPYSMLKKKFFLFCKVRKLRCYQGKNDFNTIFNTEIQNERDEIFVVRFGYLYKWLAQEPATRKVICIACVNLKGSVE
jgi:hypothetical protein